MYNICRKIFFAKYLRFYTSTKNFIKIRPKMSKRKPIKKKTFFYLLTLLTYSALVINPSYTRCASASVPSMSCDLNYHYWLAGIHWVKQWKQSSDDDDFDWVLTSARIIIWRQLSNIVKWWCQGLRLPGSSSPKLIALEFDVADH